MNDLSRFRRALLTWFKKHARDLPWRRTRDPYAVWLSEILLQQTRVQQGTPYYERFVAAFPTVEALAAAPLDAVLKQWEGLGYYTRARNLHKAAQHIVREQAGRFPLTAAAWRELPGIGPYTAAAIASISLGERAAVLDGNVIRVLTRLYNIEDCSDAPAVRKQLWALAESLLPTKFPGDFNQAMMELGAMVCLPRNPQCNACPVAAFCEARRLGVQAERPVRVVKKAVPHYDVVVGVIQHNKRYLIGKRAPAGLLGGLWEFPGGKLHPGETHETALIREMREELGVDVTVGEHIATVQHAYSHFRVTLHVYRCAITRGTPHPHIHTELLWVTKTQLSNHAFPTANHKFLKHL